ncbi:MAG: GIY-YIG nuclease family protein [Thauera sp.]|jgi:putative endonuclease|nr:GIY-YIG nuclease family protein [Thauera sp.]
MYILQCADQSYYTGSTWSLEKRLWEHQQGLGARHTAKRLPVQLVYCEEFERIDEAFHREKQVQGWSRKKKEALMASDFNALHRLAECRNGSSHAGFDFAQPAPSSRSLSEVEGSKAGGSGIDE